MSTSSTIISSELPSAGIAEASNNTVLSYNDLTKLVHSGTLTVRDYVRKMLNLSATSMSLVVVSLLGYAIYRSYRHSRLGSAANLKSIMSSGDFNDLNSYMLEPDPDIGRNKRPIEDLEEIEKRLDEFKLSDDILKQIMEIMEDEMERGLNRTTATEADLKMLPTYVCQIPTGKESTDILALDLGGSNFRVLLIKLHENEEPKILNKVFIVSESIMKGSGDKLFSHIAHCLFLFMKNHNLDFNRTYPLGFTFSFPCRQTGLSHAILLRWTKGFSCSDVVGEDVVTLLQRAIDARNDIKVKVVVLINDTVGTLMSTAYYDKKTAVGLILGTGTNASYFESIDRIGTLNPNETFFCKEMIINTEWGAFGEKGSVDFIRSRYDEEIDKSSINVGKQIFEKMISGMYLGELARLIILDMIEKELIFVEEMKKNAYRHALFTKGSFYTKYLNEIETDSNFRFSKTRRILKELAGIENPSYEDCAVVKCICSAITRRAAKLTAAGLAVILKRMNKSEVTIAVDGSLFRYHPILHVILEDTLKNLVSPLNKFKIVLSVDGSGRGAAVVAAVAAEKDPIFKHNLQ